LGSRKTRGKGGTEEASQEGRVQFNAIASPETTEERTLIEVGRIHSLNTKQEIKGTSKRRKRLKGKKSHKRLR